MRKRSSSRAPVPAPVDPNVAIRTQIVNRFWRTLNYLSISAMYVVVYSGALYAEYLIAQVTQATQGPILTQAPIVAMTVYYVRIGTVLLALPGTLIHMGFALYSQWQLEMELVREGKAS